MQPAIKAVTATDDFELVVTFENDEEGVLDMRPYLGFGVFEAISIIEKFKTAKVSFDTVEWDGGVDLDPEFIYEKCRRVAKA